MIITRFNQLHVFCASLFIGASMVFTPLNVHATWFNPDVGAIAGTDFDLSDDDHAGPIPLGFAFPFFGEVYTEVFFNSNGSLTFGAGRDSWDNYAFPRSGPDQFGDMIVPTIAPFFDDHDQSVGGTLSFINEASSGGLINDLFIATWSNVPLFGRDDVTNEFQVVLFGPDNPFFPEFPTPNGSILFNYGDLQGTGGTADASSGAFGVSDGTATVGLNKGDGVSFAVLASLGIGNSGGIITPADFSALESLTLDPFIFTPDDLGGFTVFAVPFSDLPEIPGFTTPAVPEPATIALLGIGLAGIGFAGRKNKKHSEAV